MRLKLSSPLGAFGSLKIKQDDELALIVRTTVMHAVSAGVIFARNFIAFFICSPPLFINTPKK